MFSGGGGPKSWPLPFCCSGSHQDNHGLLTLICFHGDRKALSVITEISVLSAFVLFRKQLMQTICRPAAAPPTVIIRAAMSTSDVTTYTAVVIKNTNNREFRAALCGITLSES